MFVNTLFLPVPCQFSTCPVSSNFFHNIIYFRFMNSLFYPTRMFFWGVVFSICFYNHISALVHIHVCNSFSLRLMLFWYNFTENQYSRIYTSSVLILHYKVEIRKRIFRVYSDMYSAKLCFGKHARIPLSKTTGQILNIFSKIISHHLNLICFQRF